MNVRWAIRSVQPDWLTLQLVIQNHRTTRVRVGRLTVLDCQCREPGILSLPPENFRFFREGWSVVSPAGTLTWGQTNFPISKAYLPFGTLDPEQYSYSIPNQWTAEGVGLLYHSSSDKGLLVGALGCRRQFSRIDVNFNVFPATLTAQTLGDEFYLLPGQEMSSEEIVVAYGEPQALLQHYAELVADVMSARPIIPTPRMWCSWNGYFDRVDQSDVVKAADFLVRHRRDLPVEYIQVDDGFQQHLGDWFNTRPTFPEGLEGLAAEIRRRGFKPGLWVAPFWIEENSDIHRRHPEWVLKNRVGRPVFMPIFHNRPVAAIDCTLPEVQQWIFDTFERFCKIGYEMFKLDFIVGEALHGSNYANSSMTRCEAYRAGLSVIRQAIGNRLLLLGTGIPLASVGLVDAARVAADSIHRWFYSPESRTYREAASFPNIFRNLAARAYCNRIWWINDPDAPMTREGQDKRDQENELTNAEIQVYLSAHRLCGGTATIGEKLETLPESRLAAIRQLFCESGLSCRILDLFEREVPRIWWQAQQKNSGLLGLFNWEERPISIKLPLAKLHVTAEQVTCRNFWQPQETLTCRNELSFSNIPPHSCTLFQISEVTHP